MILEMREEDDCSWEGNAKATHRTPEATQMHLTLSTSRAGVGKTDVSDGQQQKRR
jgi:hypothetical protein